MNWSETKGTLLGGAGVAALLFPAALYFYWDTWTTRTNLLEDRTLLLAHETRLVATQESLKRQNDFLAKSARFHYEIKRLGLEPHRWERLEVALDQEEMPYPKIVEVLNQAVPGPKHLFAPKLLEITAPPPESSEAEKKKLPPSAPAAGKGKQVQPLLTLHGAYIARRDGP